MYNISTTFITSSLSSRAKSRDKNRIAKPVSTSLDLTFFKQKLLTHKK